MMLPLGGIPTLEHVLERTKRADTVDEVVLATTQESQDDILTTQAEHSGVSVFRGSERDVLERAHTAARHSESDLIVRVAGDCPVISPEIIDHAVTITQEGSHEYVSNKLERTFPMGLDVEVFSKESFDVVEQAAEGTHQREHPTLYYINNSSEFSTYNITSDEIFTDETYHNRTDIELMLDEAGDYWYLDAVFDSLDADNRNMYSVIDYIDAHDLNTRISDIDRTTKEDVRES